MYMNLAYLLQITSQRNPGGSCVLGAQVYVCCACVFRSLPKFHFQIVTIFQWDKGNFKGPSCEHLELQEPKGSFEPEPSVTFEHH